MPVPPVLGNRLTAAIAAVNATTDLDLLISYLDVGQRSGVDISLVTAEIARRSNLVDANTPYTTAAKLAVAMFKIDNPAPALWGGGASGAGGGGAVLGQYVSGWLGNNPNFVSANGSLYLASAYPDMLPLLTDRIMESFYTPSAFRERIVRHAPESSFTRQQRTFVDGNTIIVPQHPQNSTDYYLLNVSLDGGATWRGVIYRGWLTQAAVPELTSVGMQSGPAHVVDVVKLDSPGHYAALVAQNTNSGNVALIRSEDGGLTWFGWQLVASGADLTNTMGTRLFYRNGAFLYLNASASRYSVDNGVTWFTMNSANWRNSDLRLTGELSSDGYLSYSSQSTSMNYFLWPAAPGLWTINLDFTSRSAVFATAVNVLKRCGTTWVAWNNSSGNNIYVTTNIVSGTWTRTQVTNVSLIYDVTEVDGNLFVLGLGSTGVQIFTAPVSTSVPTTLTSLSATDFPVTVNAASANRWPIPTGRFATMLGANVGAFFRHGRVAIAKYVGITGPTRFQHVMYDQPIAYAVGFCYKYNRWYTSIPAADVSLNAAINQYSSAANAVPGHQMLHLTSTDGVSWVPVGVGYGHIIDGGSRLVRVNGVGQIEISTNGTTWTTSGVTQPTGLPTVVWVRLWRVKDCLFLCVNSDGFNNTTAWLGVSTNGGLSWSATSGLGNQLSIAYCQAGIVNFRNAYYALAVYYSSNPSSVTITAADQFAIYRSTNGVNWSYVTGNTFTSTGNARWDHIGMFNHSGLLCVMAGGRSNGSNNAPYFTSDGLSWSTTAQTTLTSTLSNTTILSMDTHNGEQRWSFDQSWVIQGTNGRKLTTFRDGVVDVSMYGYPSTLPVGLSGSGSDLMGLTGIGTVTYNSGSLAFLAATPTGMQLAHLKVTK